MNRYLIEINEGNREHIKQMSFILRDKMNDIVSGVWNSNNNYYCNDGGEDDDE
jgi:hypothetical protein